MLTNKIHVLFAFISFCAFGSGLTLWGVTWSIVWGLLRMGLESGVSDLRPSHQCVECNSQRHPADSAPSIIMRYITANGTLTPLSLSIHPNVTPNLWHRPKKLWRRKHLFKSQTRKPKPSRATSFSNRLSLQKCLIIATPATT